LADTKTPATANILIFTVDAIKENLDEALWLREHLVIGGALTIATLETILFPR